MHTMLVHLYTLQFKDAQASYPVQYYSVENLTHFAKQV